jgi:hypothetical protein
VSLRQPEGINDVTAQKISEQISRASAYRARSWPKERPYKHDPEIAVCIALSTAADLGLLGRFRQCGCEKWFFARGDQKSCSAACRHKRYEQTTGSKRHRRDYMNWFYAMYQSPKAPQEKVDVQTMAEAKGKTMTAKKVRCIVSLLAVRRAVPAAHAGGMKKYQPDGQPEGGPYKYLQEVGSPWEPCKLLET